MRIGRYAVIGALAGIVSCATARAQAIGTIEADATVRQDAPSTNLGADAQLVADASAGRVAQVFLRVRASGIGASTVTSARLLLSVPNPSWAGSDSGGVLYATSCQWSEATITWSTRPATSPGIVASVGAVDHKATATFDLTAAIPGDGLYCFALVSASPTDDDVVYQSRETGAGGPRLVLTLGPPATTSSTAAPTTTLPPTTTTVPTTSTTTTTTTRAPTTTTSTTRPTTTTTRPPTTTTSTTRRTTTTTRPPTTTTSTTRPTTTTTRPPTTTTSTTRPSTTTTTLPAGPFACLSQSGPLVTLAGVFAGAYTNDGLAPASRLDARGATFLPSVTTLYPFNVGGGAGLCLAGGNWLGQFDRTWTWQQIHDANNAAVAFDNADATIDGVRIDNVNDGIRPARDGGFRIRNVWMTYVRDDCVENDHLQDGVVEDSLFDGCYVGFSARPSQSIIDSGYDGSSKVWTIERSLVRLQPMPGPDGGSADGLGTGGFFKWHLWDDPANSLSPKLALHGNVFLAERVGQPGAARMGIPPGQLASCSDNVMVWLGPGDFPAPLPAECFTVTTDRSVWDTAVRDWFARHPGVGP